MQHVPRINLLSDRRYRLQVCDVLECKADTIEIEESVEADEVETAIIGVTTATGCNPGRNSPARFSIEGVPPKKKRFV